MDTQKTSVTNYIINERRADDELRERQVTHLLKLVTNHNGSAHEQNMRMMDDIVSSWMKKVTSSNNLFALG